MLNLKCGEIMMCSSDTIFQKRGHVIHGTGQNRKKYWLPKAGVQKPGCSYLFKEIYFSANWTAITALDSGVPLTCNDGAPYYLCPQCTAKNIVIRQGKK